MPAEQSRDSIIDELFEQATKTIILIMKTRLQEVIDDLCQLDEAQNDAVPKWIRPVKAYHMNGQCPTDTFALAPKFKFPSRIVFVSAGAAVTAVCWSLAQSSMTAHLDFMPSVSLLACNFTKVVRDNVDFSILVSAMFVLLAIILLTLALVSILHGLAHQDDLIAIHDPKKSRGGTTVNAHSRVNRNIFESATRCSDLCTVMNQRDNEVADVEVFRLLFPLHRELAEAFAAEYKGMIQRLKAVEDVVKWADQPMQKAVRWLMTNLFDSDASDATEKCNISEELNGSKCLWPMYSDSNDFISVVKTHAKEMKRISKQGSISERFFDQVDESLLGEASWVRLCHEFIWVLIHLRMPLVSSDELHNCRCSAGTSVWASPEEVVNKLVNRRLTGDVLQHALPQERDAKRTDPDTGYPACDRRRQKTNTLMSLRHFQVFAERMHFLLERDLRIAMNADGSARVRGDKRVESIDLNAVRGAHEWLLHHFDGIVQQVVWRLSKRLEDLQPWDRTMQNGRVDLTSKKMHRAHDERQTPCLVHGQCNGTRFMQSTRAGEFYIALTSEINLTLDYSNMSSGSTSPWGDVDLASEDVHNTALKIHKVVLADAIFYFRPRLRKVMAAMVDEETLRVGLHFDPELNYLRFYARPIDEKRRACAVLQEQAELLRLDLKDLANFRDCHG
eukprot:TRINITY_DN27811_c1_g1_i1.p1 TRINITY_DN27811_c1_g1~~TRINITY_DN27811_c1_g1_i1.p1  ORF type:complete len:752 (+),score=134.20 TRINITY_DN27811_c1_g1_i1:236-2257(+)